MKNISFLMIVSVSVLSTVASMVWVPALASDAYGEPFEGWGFVKDDWQLVCDNTLTCRAVGYADEGAFDTPASLLLTATPKVALPLAEIQFLDEGQEQEQSNAAAELWLNDKNYGTLPLENEGYNYRLTAKQTGQLIKQAHLDSKIEIRQGAHSWIISDKGMNAVLLKLDDVQGRVGTALALVSKNSPNRQTPKSAKPLPVVKKAYSYAEDDRKQLDPAKLIYFRKNIEKWVDIDAKRFVGFEDDMGDCELVNPSTEEYQRMQEYTSSSLDWDFIPLDAKHTLASHLCWRGAYNEGAGYWLISHDKPSQTQLITTSGSDYSNGEIYAAHKDRGIGDCWNTQEWVWNGKTFVMTVDSSTGMCRGFAGGAWGLPTYVSEVIE